MRKYVSLILMCLFLSIPISAQEYVSNGIKQSQAVAVLPKPKLAIYVDNRLYNNTLIGPAMISKEGNLMIPNSANVVKDRYTSRAIEFSNGYQISIDRKTLTTPQGQRKITTETAVYNGCTYYSYSFLTKDLGVKVTKQVIEGIPCYFFWKDLSPSTEPKPDLLPVSQYMEYIPNFIIGEGGEIVRPDEKHTISTRQLGSNIYNTVTRPKDSTFEEDLAYLRSLNYDGQGYRAYPYGSQYMNTYISYRVKYPEIRMVSVQSFTPYSETLQFNERETVIESQNQMIEALKYYSQDPNDAMLIFNYVNTCYKNKVTIPNKVIMTFGKTRVYFERGRAETTDFGMLFHQDNWENVPGVEWNRGMTLDYTLPKDGDILIGDSLNPKNVLGGDELIGSNTYLTKVRNAKSTLKQDIAYLNTLMITKYENPISPYVALCGCNYEVHKHLLDGKKEILPYDSQGYMNVWTFEAVKTSDRIEATSGNGRKFTMSAFWYRNQLGLSDDTDMRMTYRQNMIIETIKYLSKDVEDGKRIYLYLNECIINKQQPTLKTVMTFGKTKVKFTTGAQGQGYSIEFLP